MRRLPLDAPSRSLLDLLEYVASAQGDWLCDACAAGAPPPRRARALTAVDKFLAGRLGLARVEGFWARGDGPPMVDLRWLLRPEDLHTGRLVCCSLLRAAIPL